MSCKPISVTLEVDPSDIQKIVFGLDKSCNDDDTAEWKLHFELLERADFTKEFATVVKLDVDINKENHPQAEATAKNGLDESQRGQAQIAAQVAKDPEASDDDKKDAAEGVIEARQG